MPPEPSELAIAVSTEVTTTTADVVVAESGSVSQPPAPPDLPTALFAPNDPRYPRPLLVRGLRLVGQWCWIILAAYPLTGIYNFIGAINAGQLFTPHTAGQAFYLDRIVPAVAAQPLDAIPPLAAVALLALVARVCYRDHSREREEMDRRQKRGQRLAEYQSLAERAEQAAEGAAFAAAGAIGEAAVQPVIEAASPIGQAIGEAAVKPILDAVTAFTSGERERQEPQGPPFDEDMLPPPERFVGRVDDRPWLVERLKAGGTTSVTALGGIGGIGKTALAAVAIRDVRAAGCFPDGIAVVRCQEKEDPFEVLRLALTRFDPYRRAPEATDAAGLTDAARRLLKGKDALIVFDNVEPALSDRLGELVNPLRAGDATLLFTARQRLPASVVPRDASRELDLLSEAEALELFAQSYGAHDAAMLSATDRAAAVRIVKALANHTLAVKLAGAYAADCDRPLDTLAGELEAHPLGVPGDKGERAVAIIFRQSTDQLPAPARRLFAALAAFPTLEFGRAAALRVAELLDLSAPDGPNLVDLLIRRAVLDAETNDGMPPASDRERLRLHPLLGAYAAEQLGSWPAEERDAAFLAVATHYAAYASATADAALGPDEQNITGALEWANDHHQDALVVALCTGMQYYWRDRSRTPLSLTYLPSAVAITAKDLGEQPVPDVDAEAVQAWKRRAHALFWLKLNLGYAYQTAGRLRKAEEQYGECLQLARAADARRNEGAAISVLGQIAQRRGQLDAAAEYFAQSLVIRREVQDRQGEGAVLSSLGQIALARGQLDAAAEYFAQSLVIRREVQDRQGEGVVLYHLALLAEAQGNLDRAEQLHRESLAIAVDVQSGQDIADSLLVLGQFLITKRQGKRDEGCAMLREAVAIYHAMGVPGEEQARAVALALGCAME